MPSFPGVGGLAVTTDRGIPVCLPPMLEDAHRRERRLRRFGDRSVAPSPAGTCPPRRSTGCWPTSSSPPPTAPSTQGRTGQVREAVHLSHQEVLRLRGRPSVLRHPRPPSGCPTASASTRVHRRAGLASSTPVHRQRRAKPGRCSPDAIARPSRRGDPPGGAAGRDRRERGERRPQVPGLPAASVRLTACSRGLARRRGPVEDVPDEADGVWVSDPERTGRQRSGGG